MSVVVGSCVAGRYRVTEPIWDHPARGRYRGVDELEPHGSVLVAVTAGQRGSLEDVRRQLAFELEGVTALREVGELDVPLGPLHGLVEAEPPGKPIVHWRSSEIPRPATIAIAARVAEIAARAHASGMIFGGFHPELIYAEERDGQLGFTAMAPRAIAFFRTGGRVDAANIPAFDMVFEPLAVAVAGAPPTASSDVFALAGTLGFFVTGRHPFPGQSWAQQIDAMSRQDGEWRDLDDPLLRLLETCLRRDASRRPTAAQLCERIHALG